MPVAMRNRIDGVILVPCFLRDEISQLLLAKFLEILGATIEGHTAHCEQGPRRRIALSGARNLSALSSVEVENVGTEIDLALRFTKPLPHLQRNRLCEFVALLMHDDSGLVDDCLDLRRN